MRSLRPGGRRDVWQFGGCRRRYTDKAYRAAVAQAANDLNPLKTGAEVEQLLGIKSSTLRTWVDREQIPAPRKDERGRNLYDIAAVRAHAMRGGLLGKEAS